MSRIDDAARDYFGFYAKTNIRFDIEENTAVFYETLQPVNNEDIFDTFEEARTAAIKAFAEYKEELFSEVIQAEKDLLTADEDVIIGYNPDGGW